MDERTRRSGGQGLRRVAAAVLLLAAGTAVVDAVPARAEVYGSDYVGRGRCGPYPRVAVKSPDWLCLGIVAGPDAGLIMPRTLVEIGTGRFVLADMGGWQNGRGRILALVPRPDGQARVTTLFDKLDMPHGLAVGPDRKVYVGEVGRIWRFDPAAATLAKEPVIDGLPSQGRHPLKHFVFDKEGNLVINFGAPTDRCEVKGKSSPPYPCPAVTGDKPEAALWRLAMTWPEGKPGALTEIARGLRNSMALAVHPSSGLLLQGENSVDLKPDDDPPEELNVIRPGRHYGWPYCVGREERVPDYRKAPVSCRDFEPPALLLPGHAAPLGMAYYTGPMFPELAGKLVVGFHGYRDNGHRIVAYDVDAEGRPVPADGKPPGFGIVLVDDWVHAAGRGPDGAPVGITVASDGSIWFPEDKNRTVMVLMRSTGGRSAPAPLPEPAPKIAAGPPPKGWAALFTGLLKPRCAGCHVEYRSGDPAKVWERLAARAWVDPADVARSKIVAAMKGVVPMRPMPPPTGLAADAKALARLEAFLESLK